MHARTLACTHTCTHTHTHTHTVIYQGNVTEEKVSEKSKAFKEDLKGLTEVESKSCQEQYVVILTAVAPLT